MDLNKLLNLPLSTLMQHRLNLSDIWKNKEYKLINYSEPGVLGYFIVSIESEHDIYRGSENNVSYYSPFTSYPDQTMSEIFYLGDKGQRVKLDAIDIRDQLSLFDKPLFLFMEQDSPSDHDESYNDAQIYNKVLDDQWGAIEIFLGNMQRLSKNKSELTLYYKAVALANRASGMSDPIAFKYQSQEIHRNKYNLDLTFVSLLTAYFKLTKKYDYDEIVSIFENFKKHLDKVEAYLQGDEFDVGYCLNQLNLILLDGV